MGDAATVYVVSHFHWDREWYRTMQGFRARLVDAIDQVLDLAAADEGYRFVLDGQTIVLDDYLVVRPDRRAELTDHIATGRLAIGPWYVQPDSLLPSGEAHVRNLLEGRRHGQSFGPVSSVAYVPDSFGHPAQFPQLFAGFGLGPFVHWRGNGAELDALGPRWRWHGPDGTSVPVWHLTDGYFGASRPPDDPLQGAPVLAELARRQHEAGENPVILMNGFDHTRPDAHIGAVIGPLAQELGAPVRQATLDEAAADKPPDADRIHQGELVGGRVANLLPGVWSTRMPLKIANRRIEHLLEHWAEPWSALGQALGLRCEADALRESWRKLLRNQAHDSICGCSTDAVHTRMGARYHDAEGLAAETLQRVLERLAGRGLDRDTPPPDEMTVTVFNPSPHPVTGLVRIPLDAHPALAMHVGRPEIHPLVLADQLGFTVDAQPVRVVASDDPDRVRWMPGQQVFDIELVVTDVAPFGCRHIPLTAAPPVADDIDDGTEIAVPSMLVQVESDGTISFEHDGVRWDGLFGLQDQGDRGDSYDHDPVGPSDMLAPTRWSATRRRHPSGIQRMRIQRSFDVPAGLDATREARSTDTVSLMVDVEVTLVPGATAARFDVSVHDPAADHRLRLVFPTGEAPDSCDASTMFDQIERAPGASDDDGWLHPAPTTFCQHGLVRVDRLAVMAPGLPEAEISPTGSLLLTLARSVGWLARMDLHSRPVPAGPEMPVPGAQCREPFETTVWLAADATPAAARAVMAGLRGVVGGPLPMLDGDRALVTVDDPVVVLSALKPADDGNGLIVRLANPTDARRPVELRVDLLLRDVSPVGLDEVADGHELDHTGSTLRMSLGPHQLATLRLVPEP